jgi:hypothetical protein
VRRRGEAPLPKTLTDENDGSGAGLIFFGTKFATEGLTPRREKNSEETITPFKCSGWPMPVRL